MFAQSIPEMWPNPTKPGTSLKTCFWVNSHKKCLAQNYFQIFKFVFSYLLSGEQCILSNAWKNLFKWEFFQTINDGLSLLIPIHSCSKWKTKWSISDFWMNKIQDRTQSWRSLLFKVFDCVCHVFFFSSIFWQASSQ